VPFRGQLFGKNYGRRCVDAYIQPVGQKRTELEEVENRRAGIVVWPELASEEKHKVSVAAETWRVYCCKNDYA
jgi:hypothetical protein